MQVDQRGRSYLAKLGFGRGATLVAEPLEGEDDAWIIRPGRVITDAELSLLSNPRNVESLHRAAVESLSGVQGIDLF